MSRTNTHRLKVCTFWWKMPTSCLDGNWIQTLTLPIRWFHTEVRIILYRMMNSTTREGNALNFLPKWPHLRISLANPKVRTRTALQESSVESILFKWLHFLDLLKSFNHRSQRIKQHNGKAILTKGEFKWSSSRIRIRKSFVTNILCCNFWTT